MLNGIGSSEYVPQFGFQPKSLGHVLMFLVISPSENVVASVDVGGKEHGWQNVRKQSTAEIALLQLHFFDGTLYTTL